jgi:hypothetical protein
MMTRSPSFLTRTVRATVIGVVPLLFCDVGPTAAQPETDLVCTLSAEILGDTGGANVVTFAARVDCSPGKVPAILSDEAPDSNMTQLQFYGTEQERVIIGASLTDEAPSVAGEVENPRPDFDFPIRFITIAASGDGTRWSFAAETTVVEDYGHLIMRVWNPSALTDCPQGRDGCEKFGYILLWDQRRAEGALELVLR